MTDYRDLLPVVVETSGAQMPDGFNLWGIKTTLPDLTTTHGFRWASPGGMNVSNEHLERGNGGACPRVPGDGLCVATTWRGMASGGIPARTLLLVAYRAADAAGMEENEVCPVFMAQTEQAEPVPDPEEADDWAWVTPEDLRSAVTATPFAFSPWMNLQVNAGVLDNIAGQGRV